MFLDSPYVLVAFMAIAAILTLIHSMRRARQATWSTIQASPTRIACHGRSCWR
jgi:hypothetical protein